ncbi:4-hydroxyphenylacetate catabolism regulator HpaA, partial [Pseudomonas avellanae]
PALRNFHLLLPLILLNAEKPRRQVDRTHAVTRLNTLLIELPQQAAQEVRP